MAITVDYIQDGENNEAAVFNRPLNQLASEIDKTNLSVVPSGVITMWSGSVATIPDQWVLCNGANGTPDLRDRFVVGSGGSYPIGAVGGSANAVVVAHSHSASTGTSGWHDHTGSTNTTGAHTHANSTDFSFNDGGSGEVRIRSGSDTLARYTAAGQFDILSNGNHSHSLNINASGNHTHTVSVGVEGESGTGKNLPPYYALAYIMKT